MPVSEEYSRETCDEVCTNVQQLDWEDFFTDPNLQQLINLALENNRDLWAAIERIDTARAIHGLLWADLLPTVDANAATARARLPGNILPVQRQSFIFSVYAAAVSISSWEVDLWGRLRNLNDAALENYLSTEEAAQATYISLIGQVANAYLIELELNELVNISQKTVENRQASFRLTNQRFEEGSSAKLEVTQAETLLQEAQSDLTTLERKRELNWNAMTLLVGTEITPNHKMLHQSERYFIKGISPGLPSELLYNRPDILAAEHRLKAANANIGAARAAFFPTISLTGAYGTASRELNNLFTNFWFYYPNLSVPIFDWGRNMSDLGLAKSLQNLAVIDYEHTIQVAFREVSDALTDRAWLEKQVGIQEKALAAQKENSRLAQLRYEAGSSPYLDVLDAKQNVYAAEQTLVQTRRAFLASGINLYTALGG